MQAIEKKKKKLILDHMQILNIKGVKTLKIIQNFDPTKIWPKT